MSGVEMGPEQRIRDVAVSLVVGGYMSTGHDLERRIKAAERELLEFACDEIKRHIEQQKPLPRTELDSE